MREGTYIRFCEMDIPPGQITPRWSIETREDGDYLGIIKWFGRWRKFAFFPAAECVFEETCLREISDFLEEQCRARKGGKS